MSFQKSSDEETSSEKKCEPSAITYGILAFIGLCLIVGGIFFIAFFRIAIDNYIFSKLPLAKKSDVTKTWISPPVKPFLKIYVFNVTNPKEYLEGQKPKLKEFGPYVYSEKWEKIQNAWFKNETEVEYEQKKTYFFNPELSVGSESEKFIVPNIPMMAAISKIRYAPLLLRIGLGSMLELFDQKPFVSLSIKELMWGYENPLIKFGNDILSKKEKLPFDKFGFFYGKNETNGKRFKVHTGVKNFNNIGKIISYRGESEMKFWEGKECNAIRGTDGSIFHPNINKNETLFVFSPDLCQSVPLAFKEEVTSQDIPGYRYVPPLNAFGTPTENPRNECFCPNGCQSVSGLFNISACQFGAPIMISWPHFFQADPRLLEKFEGLEPDARKHQFYIDVQPKLGIGLRAAVRSQINVVIRKLENAGRASRLRDIIFPVIWLEEGLEEIGDEATINLIRKAVVTPELIRKIAYPSLLATGLLVLSLVIGLSVAHHCTSERLNSLKKLKHKIPKNK